MNNPQGSGPLPTIPQEEGWFCLRGGEVTGPIAPLALQGLIKSRPAGLQVSQKGFSQWYGADEILPILERSIAWDVQKSADLTGFQSALMDGIARLGRLTDEIKHQREEPAAADSSVPLHEAPISGIEPIVLGVETPVELLTEIVNVDQPRLVEEFRLNFVPRMPRDYYLVKGKLRLGKLRSSAWLGVVSLLLVGLNGLIWGAKAFRELTWHLGEDCFKSRRPVALLFLPGISVVGFLLIANKLRMAEKQNGYSKVSPALAALLGVFPPLAMVYLQRGMTRHWQLHVDHALKSGLV